jgi:uncharacterized membrane protein
VVSITPVKIARIGVFVSLALIGSLMKVPSPIGSPALDSAPGYFSSLAFGAFEGGVVAGLGHILTSFNVGFPLGFLHGLIALGMSACAILFRYFHEKVSIAVAIVFVTFLNGIVLPLVVVPFFGVPVYLGLVPSLLLASGLNIVLAGVLYTRVEKVFPSSIK